MSWDKLNWRGNVYISSIRRKLPKDWRLKLKEMTGKHPILTFLIALLYGFLLKPYRNPWIWKKGIPKIYVNPDISAIDCAIEIFINKVYERFYELKKGDTVIDVGANVGMFTIKASLSVGEKGKVIAIEPVEENFRVLRRNIEYHRCDNVILLNKACGNRKGKSIMLISLLSGTHQLKSVGKDPEFFKKEVEVDTDTLDNICKEIGISRIDFLKIDVEGAEMDVLKGAEESLNFTRNIAMELHYDGEGEEVKKFLEERGFTVKISGNMLYAMNNSIQ